jgi:hypothetical protein
VEGVGRLVLTMIYLAGSDPKSLVSRGGIAGKVFVGIIVGCHLAF